MGICHAPQKNSESQISLEQQFPLPISIEKTPNNIQKSLKHDLKANYIDQDCTLDDKPELKEIAIQTSLSFHNLSNTIMTKKEHYNVKEKKSQKTKKKQQKNERTQSVSLKKSQPLEQQYTSLNLLKEMKVHQNGYIVLINSQKDNIRNSQKSVQKNRKQ